MFGGLLVPLMAAGRFARCALLIGRIDVQLRCCDRLSILLRLRSIALDKFLMASRTLLQLSAAVVVAWSSWPCLPRSWFF